MTKLNYNLNRLEKCIFSLYDDIKISDDMGLLGTQWAAKLRGKSKVKNVEALVLSKGGEYLGEIIKNNRLYRKI